MSTAIILGDIHLGKNLSIGKTGLGTNLNSRLIDQTNLLEWVLEKAHEISCNDIIITGDVFEDPKAHPNIITLFFSWLKKCQIANVNVHIIYGNHDILRTGSFYTSPLDIISESNYEHVYIYKDISTIYMGDSAITMVPFRDRKSFGVDSNAKALELLQNNINWELASIPSHYNKMLIGHLVLEGSIPIGDEIDDITNELFCPLSMFNGYNYVWMGHVHKPQVLQKHPNYIAHIGSMDISNFGETEHKKHIVIFDLDKKSFSIDYLPTRALKKVSLVIPKDTLDTTNFIISEIDKLDLDKSIIKMEITLSDITLQSVDKSVIEKKLIEKGVFSISGIFESKKSQNIIKKEQNSSFDSKMDLNSAIKEYAKSYVDELDRNEFIELALELAKELKD